MATSLPVQLQISLNARLFKLFNLRDQRTFTIAHLKNTLATSFHISSEEIKLNLVSGRFTHDNDALFDLRASDGNWASLDVELPEAHAQSSLSNGIISFSYCPNNVLPSTPQFNNSSQEIYQVPLFTSNPLMLLASTSSSSSTTPFSMVDLSREQRIAIRAQLEDPFSIASKSCFEDDSDDDEDYDHHSNDSDSDIDDDLYSDDGEIVSDSGFADSDCSSTPSSPMTSPLSSPISTSFWPSDPSKLTAGHLRHLLSIVPPRDSRRETPLRNSLLRYTFQRRILSRLEKASTCIPINSFENLKLTTTLRTCPLPSPVTPVTPKAVPASTLRDAIPISFP